jgi:hypothetical protein
MESKQEDTSKTEPNLLPTVLRYLALLIAVFLGLRMIYLGCLAITTRSIATGFGQRPSGPWFPRPLSGTPAVAAGLSLIFAAAGFLSICILHFPLGTRLPRWARFTPWIFFVGWLLLKLLANHL